LKRERLLLAILRADPRAGCVRRKRKARDYFSSGGTEMELSRSSRVGSALEQARESPREELSALVVLGTRAQQRGARMRSISITAAAPVPLSLLAKANLGELRVARAQLKAGRILTTSERTWAGRVIETRETSPKGVLARQAIGQLYLQGSLFRPQKEEALRRLSRRALAARLGRHPEFPFFKDCQAPPTLEDWLSTHLEELGVESTDDLSLLSPEDFLPEDVPAELKPTLEDRFPLEVDVGDCVYRAEYDLEKRQVLLTAIRGGRKTPPPAGYLPRFEGLRVYAEAGGSFHLVRRG
jgi:hypothetical protein